MPVKSKVKISQNFVAFSEYMNFDIVESVGFSEKMDIHNWLDDDGLEKLKADRQPFEAPSCHYTPKPNEPGKMFWFSGKASMDNNN